MAGYGYDVVNIAAIALRTGEVVSTAIKENLYAIKDFPGVTGSTSFDSNGDVVKELKMMQVKSGEFTAF